MATRVEVQAEIVKRIEYTNALLRRNAPFEELITAAFQLASGETSVKLFQRALLVLEDNATIHARQLVKDTRSATSHFDMATDLANWEAIHSFVIRVMTYWDVLQKNRGQAAKMGLQNIYLEAESKIREIAQDVNSCILMRKERTAGKDRSIFSPMASGKQGALLSQWEKIISNETTPSHKQRVKRATYKEILKK